MRHSKKKQNRIYAGRREVGCRQKCARSGEIHEGGEMSRTANTEEADSFNAGEVLWAPEIIEINTHVKS